MPKDSACKMVSAETTERVNEMDPIKNVNDKVLAFADGATGTVVKKIGKKETIEIYVPVGGRIAFTKENTFTSICREGNYFAYECKVYLKTG